MSFCQRHNFQVDKVPLENGGWIGGRQNLWLIASLMWQGPTVWGNWSALCVDTFCVSLSCRLLLAWPQGPRGRAVCSADCTWSAPTFLLWLSIGPRCPAVANLLVNINLSDSEAQGGVGVLQHPFCPTRLLYLHRLSAQTLSSNHLFFPFFGSFSPIDEAYLLNN